MQKKKLLLVIDNLRKGGAEVLLVGTLTDLAEHYDIILVTLTEGSDFPEVAIHCKERHLLGFSGKYSLLQTVWKLKKIIKKTQPSIVHAHLFYSSLVARLACPSPIPLLYTLHNELSKNIFNKQPLLGLLEKYTIRPHHAVVAVSNLVLDDYASTIKLPSHHYVLKNYIADDFFEIPPRPYHKEKRITKLIAVGNIKQQKNYEYLLHTMAIIKPLGLTLDVYGKKDKVLYPKLQALIEKEQLPVVFKGPADDMHLIYPEYDLFLMASSYEGFGLVVVEAMASGLPVLLSDIPVFREVTNDSAWFFDLNNSEGLANLLKLIIEDRVYLQAHNKKGRNIAEQYTKQQYIQSLLSIYGDILHSQ